MTIRIAVKSKVTLTLKTGEKINYNCHPNYKPSLSDDIIVIPIAEHEYEEIWSGDLRSINVIDEVE